MGKVRGDFGRFLARTRLSKVMSDPEGCKALCDGLVEAFWWDIIAEYFTYQ